MKTEMTREGTEDRREGEKTKLPVRKESTNPLFMVLSLFLIPLLLLLSLPVDVKFLND